MRTDKYKPGDLVRVIHSVYDPAVVGKIIMITGPRTLCYNRDSGIQWMGYTTDHISPDGSHLCPREENIMPVNDDGYKAGSWDECLWKPDSKRWIPSPQTYTYTGEVNEFLKGNFFKYK